MSKYPVWDEVSSEIVYKKYSQIIERRDYKLPNGNVADFYVRLELPGTCALAITADQKIVTIPQFRPGPRKALRELPGGRIDPGEDPRMAAARELLEETGYAGDVQDWVGTWESDAYTETHRHVVIIQNCKKIAEPKLDEFEFGKAELVDLEDFIMQVRAGQLTDVAGALLALDKLGLLT